MQIADGAGLLVADFCAGETAGTAWILVRWVVINLWQGIRKSAKREYSGTLEAAQRSVGRLQLPDPHSAVPSGTADGSVTARDDDAGASGQARFLMGVKEPEAAVEQ